MFETMRRISVRWVAAVAFGFVLTGGAYDDAAGVDKCDGFISCGNPYPCCDNGSDEDGNCTWWAWKMMYDRWGYKAASDWGMAGQSWLTKAAGDGLPTGDTPRVGAIFVRVSDTGVGHVGYVVSFSETSIVTTEMCCRLEGHTYPCTQYTHERDDVNTYSWPDDNFLGFIYPPDGSGPVPDTGVVKCYDADGDIIDCPDPGQPFYGQDGNYSINPPSYTKKGSAAYSKLDARGEALPAAATSWSMVRDNVTGLVWEVKTDDGSIHDKDNRYTWYDAWDTFIYGLNDAKFGGYCDWRLPTIKELAYLVDYSIPYPGPTINTTFFPNTLSSYYWSSTTDAYSTDYAWGVYFSYGHDGWSYKSYDYYVRAVRGGQ